MSSEPRQRLVHGGGRRLGVVLECTERAPHLNVGQSPPPPNFHDLALALSDFSFVVGVISGSALLGGREDEFFVGGSTNCDRPGQQRWA